MLTDPVADYVSTLLVERGVELALLLVLVALWRWWMGLTLRNKIRDELRKEFDAKLNELKERSSPAPLSVGEAIIQNFHGDIGTVNVGADGLYRTPFEGSGEIVSTAKAPPITFAAGVPSLTVSGRSIASPTLQNWRASPGAGRLAAELIAKAADLEAAREIWETFYASPRRTETRWAYWAFASRLQDAGFDDEIYSLILELAEKHEEIDPNEEIEAQVQRWKEEKI